MHLVTQLHALNIEKQKLDTIGHLESQLVASLALTSSEEYKKWLELYVRRVVLKKFLLLTLLKLTEEIHAITDPEHCKLEKLCKELLGPMHVPHTLAKDTDQTMTSNTGPLLDGTWNPVILVAHYVLQLKT
jgi:hypothetical protein